MSKTSTPMLKFLMNEPFEPSEARHITHWATLESEHRTMQSTAASASRNVRGDIRGLIELNMPFLTVGLLTRVSAAARNSACSSRENCPVRKPTADKFRLQPTSDF